MGTITFTSIASARLAGARGQVVSDTAWKAPRHFVFHPRAPYFFMTNEGKPASRRSISILTRANEARSNDSDDPRGLFRTARRAVDIRMHPNAKFIYSANRGDDSIAIFSIDEATGRMAPVETVKTGGRGPREMNFDPSGKFLFACNLQSNDVTTFAVDANTGKMTQGPKVDVPQAAVSISRRFNTHCSGGL